MRVQGPLIFAFVVGTLMLAQFFIPHPSFLTAYNLILDWKQVVFGCTLILGVVSLMRFHVKRIDNRAKHWPYSIVTLVGFFVMSISALIWKTETGPYRWLFDYVQMPMQATMFSLLAFFVASAMYRAFKARTVNAALLLTAGVIVMIGRVPLGNLIAFDLFGRHFELPQLSTWILDVPNLAAKRGILIGVGLGMASTAIKVILGIERGYLGKT